MSFDGGMLYPPDIALDLLSWQTVCVVCQEAVLLRKACEVQSQVTVIFHLHSCTQLCHMFALLKCAKQMMCFITNSGSADMSGCGLDSCAMNDRWHYGRLVLVSTDHQRFLQLLQRYVFPAVTDMFFDYPFDLDENDKECVQQYGIHSQYNWAAYK